MKNDEMVTDANMLVTQNTITQDQIEEVNIYLEYEEGSRLLTNLDIRFITISCSKICIRPMRTAMPISTLF